MIAYVMTVLAEFDNRVTRTGRPGDQAEPVEIWKARKLIHEQSGEPISLSMVAKAVNISANYLSEKFRQVTGTRFVDYVARTRFEKARKLLQDENLRVSEIAFMVGFQSLSQFNRVFKRFAGKPPTQYRAEHGKGGGATRGKAAKRSGNCP